MRTHLLRTFYPPPSVESDTGLAENDEYYELPALVRTITLVASNDPKRISPEDEYALGGYAGI